MLTLLFFSFSTFVFCQKNETLNLKKFTKTTTLFSAILPGAGHINNLRIKPAKKKNNLWWKLPVIYGGLYASGYFFLHNQNEYKLILDERISRDNGFDPNYLPDRTSNDLKIIQDIYSRRRDLCFIACLGVYALQIIDANVEAHLFTFDDSDDLSFSLKAQPCYKSNSRFNPVLSITYNF
jgi:hypothetical protein